MDARILYSWTITADHHADRLPDDLKFLAVSLAGWVGPEDCPFTSREISTHPEARPFRLSDEIGVLEEGFILGDVDDLPDVIPGDAEPWRAITAGWDCTIELFKNGVWQRAKYLGMFFDHWTPFNL